ncbi:phosphoinositide 3-kinase regulatory subunit 6-like [Leptonychotes weddellii]|uniref:Phosphoinositide 3-kinase regulatory subunit 6-like n=1 Tax=Leptonychotes weddellii TaxID=9713 RepID=A0A7F8Q882_LEPWE|nr:phosphoinositide 3-kinase regulatory subunit 6-like [Leptonychotes weddellii]
MSQQQRRLEPRQSSTKCHQPSHFATQPLPAAHSLADVVAVNLVPQPGCGTVGNRNTCLYPCGLLPLSRKRETQKFCLTPRLSLQLYYIPVLAPEEPPSCRHSELRELATFLGRADPWYQNTVNTLCPAIHKLAEMPPSLDTSRTVDPFILDVITYYVRMGTQPIYFQIYTVKIFRDLSQDPAEDIFLTELKVKIQDSKFPKDGFSPRRKGAAEGPGAELSICYQKALLSHRAQEVSSSLRATGLVLKALPASDTEGSGPTHAPPSAAPVIDLRCLNVSVMEVVKSSNLAGRSFSGAWVAQSGLDTSI